MKKIEIFVRHCTISKFSADRERIRGFSKEECCKNLKQTIDKSLTNITFMMDGDLNDHFLKNEKEYRVIPIQGGNQAMSWQSTLEYVNNNNFSDDQIIYFLEDDYLHRNNWNKILLEGFDLNVDYII